MKYDTTEIPASYDRARSRSPEMIQLWMGALECHLSGTPTTVVDLGCGTGRFSLPLRAHFGAPVIGIDPSRKMLAQATPKPGARDILWLLAAGERIPLRDDSVDLVFMSMVFHHFAEPTRVARECHRILRAGGIAFLRAGTTEQIDSYPPARYFPASIPIMERVLAPARDVQAVFDSAGFQSVGCGVIKQEIAATHAVYAEQVAAGGDSVLTQLRESDLADGLRALGEEAARVDPKPVIEPIDFFVFRKSDE